MARLAVEPSVDGVAPYRMCAAPGADEHYVAATRGKHMGQKLPGAKHVHDVNLEPRLQVPQGSYDLWPMQRIAFPRRDIGYRGQAALGQFRCVACVRLGQDPRTVSGVAQSLAQYGGIV